eukprot:5764814-Karenia_brevis.AAC.1
MSRRNKEKLLLKGFADNLRNEKKDGDKVLLCDHPQCAVKCETEWENVLLTCVSKAEHMHLPHSDKVHAQQ